MVVLPFVSVRTTSINPSRRAGRGFGTGADPHREETIEFAAPEKAVFTGAGQSLLQRLDQQIGHLVGSHDTILSPGERVFCTHAPPYTLAQKIHTSPERDRISSRGGRPGGPPPRENPTKCA